MLRPTPAFSTIHRTFRDSSRTKKVAFALLIAALGVVAYLVPLSVQSKGGGNDLPVGEPLQANQLAATLQSNRMAPLALAAEDFDGDGASDLVSGYGAGTGVLAIYRGNPEARAPRSEQALEDVKVGRFAAPFLPEPAMLDLPEAPDFLAASDFNRDGFKDVLAAARGGQSIYFFAGDGKGKFAPVEQVFMPGNISALLVGDTGVRDGMPEVVIGIASASGSKALVYSGADNSIWGMARSFDLPAEPKGFAIGELNDDEKLDLAVAAGQQVLIIPGVSEAEWFGGSASAMEQIAFPAAVTAVSVGQFIWDREGRDEVAALSADGTISIAAHRNLDKRQYSSQEEKLKIHKAVEFQARQKRPELFQQFMESLVQRPSNDNSWAIAQSLAGKANASAKSPVFLATRVSNSFTTDLIFTESGGSQLNLVKNEQAGPTVEAITAGGNSAFEPQAPADKSQTSNMAASEDLIAVLPMRLNLDTKTDFVMLKEGQVEPIIIVEEVNAAMVVDRTDDTAAAAAQACTAAGNDCSLRGAIIKANTTADDDIITFPAGAQTYTLTLGPRDDEFNLLGASASTGDLDIRDAITSGGNAALDGNLTITGNGSANTIIQAGLSQAAGIDRVIDINNFSGSRVQITVVLSGLTIRNGNVPEVDVDPGPDVQNFQPDGGGIQMDGLDTNANTPGSGAVGSLTISGCLVTTNLAGGQGGGVDSTAATLIINSSSTISSNQTQRSAGGGVFWGSGNVIAAQNLQINTSTIDSNTSGGDAPISLGGGVAVQGIGANHTFTTATITNNTATAIDNATDGSGTIPNGSGGGGIFFDDGALTMTGGSITSNKSNTNGGGLLFAGTTATINNVSITSNTADFNNDGFGNGGGIYNLFGAITIGNTTACTINSNAAINGGGIFNTWNLQTLNASGSITMTNGTISSNSAENNGGGFAMDVRVPTTLGTVNLNTVTLASNTANSDSAGGGDGGAIHVTTGTINSLNGVTIDNNVANSGNGDGLRQAGGTITGAGTLNFNNGDSIYLSGGTFTSTSGFVNLTGNFMRDSGNTFNHGNGTFNFSGTGAQLLNGTATSVTFNNFIVNKSNTLSTSGGLATVTVNNLTMTAGTFTAPALLDINGNTTLATGSTLTAGANITAAGNWTNNGGTFTPGSGTITWDGAVAQQINGTPVTQTFNNFVVNKSANTLSTGGSTTALVVNNLTMTLGTFTAPASLDINGNTLLTAGTLTAGAAITAAGSWTNNGGTFTPGSGTVTFDTSSVSNLNGTAASQTFNNFVVDKSGGSLTGAGSLLTLTLNGAMTLNAGTFAAGTITGISLPGNWTNNGGTFTPGSSNVTFNSTTATQSIAGSAVTQTFFTITMNKTGQILNTGVNTTTLDLNGSLVLTAGTFTAPPNMFIGGDFTQATGSIFTPGSGTVTFDGTGAQNINGTLVTKVFNHFTVNKSNTLSGAAGTTALDINGNVVLTAGTFAAGTAVTINVAGNWTNNGGTFNGGTGNVILDGPTGQSIGGSAPTTFNGLTISSAGTGAVLGQNATANGTLTLNNNLTTGANVLIQPSTAPASVAGLFDVIGSVRRTGSPLPSAVGLTFGNQNNIITFTAAGTRPSEVTITLVKTAPATFTSAVQRTYSIAQTGGTGFSATLRLRYLEGELNGNVESQLDLWRFDGSTFVDEQQTARDTVNNWVEKSGVTAFSDWTFATHVNAAPTITPNPATTIVGVQTSAIVLDRQAVDAAFVTHFKITGITNGTLFKSDGLTQINNNDFITYAEGTAGVKFTPSPNSVATGSFTVQASSSNTGIGLSTGITGTINVNQGTTSVTITSDLPDPSTPGQVVTVNYSVGLLTGSGTPTGTVTVTVSGGLETCNGTVAAGTCDITLTGTGSRTLTATYAGDSNFVGNNDTEPHEVLGPADAVDDNYSTFKNTPLNIAAPGVLTNDTGTPTVSAVGACADVTAPFENCATTAGGEVDVNADGSFSYTPLAGYVGADSFSYTATNGGGSDSATVNITVSDSLFINEILFNPPGADAPNEYLEFRGAPSATIPAGTYLVAIEGDSADNLGDVQTIINLSGLTFGTNGFLVLLQNTNTYTTVVGATVLTSTTAGFGGLPGAIFSADSVATDIEDASVTFMVIQTGTAPTLTSDIDTDDNGTPDGATFTGWSVIDSIGALDGSATTDRTYGAINYSNNTGTPGSAPGTPILVAFTASYLGRSGNTTGSTAADWVASGALGGAQPNWTLSATETEPIAFANQPLNHIGTTNFDISPPTVQSITRVNASPTNLASVDFLVTFSESVTGVDTTDFDLTTTGGIATASITGVTGSGATRTVSVNTGTGDGTIRLDLDDDDTILDGSNNKLGGVGAGNGSFTTGEVYTIDKSGPTVTINQASGQADPTSSSPINFTVVFNEAVANFVTGDVTFSGAGATTATVTETAPNDGTTYNVAVTGMNASGSVTASLLAGVASDALGNLSQASSSTDNTVTFNFVANNAPVLDNTGNMSLTSINEDVPNASNPGTLMGDIIASAGGDRITDADAGAVEGIAVTAVDNTSGTWEFSINNGTNWTAFGSPSATTARLLAANATTRVRFVPNANFHGTVATGITFRAWDQSSGTNGNTGDTSTNGGSTAFSTAIETASIIVAAVADTPSVTNASTNEDTQTSSGLVISRNAADGAEVTHFKITAITGGTLFQNDGLTSIANNAFITFAQGNAGLRFTPALNSVAAGSFTVQAATASNDGALGGSTATATITVTAVNDAPSFQIASNPPAVGESAGAQTVNSFATNFQPGPVTATDEAGQTLVGYTVTQTGSTGTLAFTGAPSIDNAGTLTYTATNGTSGTATFDVVATDSGSGTAPNVNQSVAVAFTITVNSTNDAPVLDNTGNMSLTSINEDVPNASNPGTLVGDIIASAGGDRITDADAGAVEGIAVTAVDNTNGTWEFSINNGTNWTAFGSPSATTARLLAANATTRIRFIPAANFNGTVNPGITFRAWDQTSGTNGGTADPTTNGGQTAFSASIETASITVNAVNDPPTANAQSVNTNEDTPLGITLTGSDPETPSGSLIFTVTVLPTNGVLSGSGANRTYTPNAGYNGPDSFKFTVTDTGTPALTSAEATVSITVDAVNDGPTNTVPGAQATNTNTALTFSAGNGNQISIADSDAGSNSVQVTLTGTNGTMTLSGIVGLSFTTGDGTSDPTMTFTGTIANINTALNGLVFTPTAGFSGAASLQIATNDQGNTGSGGALSDSDAVTINVTSGGALQFSSATYSVTENGGPATITITRSGGTAGTATVLFETSNGTAGSGDYTTVSQTVTFVDGDTSETVNIPITDDLFNEPDKTVNLTLSNVGGSGQLGTPVNAVLTIVDNDAAGGIVRFNSATFTVGESSGPATITVERIGTTTNAFTVDYQSSDHSNPPDFVDCTAPGPGLASSRCDFGTAVGTLKFAAGQTSATFTVLINQDNDVEGTETLSLTLSNPTGGAALGPPSNATLQITDDPTEPAANPIDTSSEFVKQHYRDFLNREPDAPGLAFWTDNIEKCNDPARRPAGQTVAFCIDKQRESTAIAFFVAPEFQMTGGFVYRLYKGSLTGSPDYDGSSPPGGRFPTYLEFMRDVRLVAEGIVVNDQISGAKAEANREQLAQNFVQRPEFVALYGGLNNTQYVNALFNVTGITPSQADKDALVAELNNAPNATQGRASVLRKIVDGTQVIAENNIPFTTSYGQAFHQKEFTRTFVFMEYIGYLRRNPDDAGFVHWLGKLTFFGGDPFRAEMVRAFILSPEYRSRFGQP